MITQTLPVTLLRTRRWASFVGVLILLLIGPREAYSQWQQHSLTHDGLVRDYWAFLPQNFQPNMPVLISVHGYDENFAWWRDYTLMHELADTAGFVLVCPIGYGMSWNSGAEDTRRMFGLDDVGFISTVIDSLRARYGVDLERVYCCGFSNGGEMTYRLACELGQRFAAVASVAGCLSDIAANVPWRPLRPMPVMHLHGTLDQLEYFDGNRPDFDLWSVAQTLDFWLQRNACAALPETTWIADIDPTDNCTVHKITWRDCSDTTQVVLYKIIGGGHSWPGSTFGFPSEGNKNMDIRANDEIWKFLKEYKNPLAKMAFGKRIEVDTLFVSPQGDSLTVNGTIENPENHPVTIYALLKGDATAHKDSFALYDDGQHWDGGGDDNLFGGVIEASGLPEDLYTVSLITYDQSLGLRHRLYKQATFTTAGPVVPASSGAVTGMRYLPAYRNQYFKLVLQNLGSTASVGNLTAELSCNDSRLAFMNSSATFADPIPAGGVDSSEGELLFRYAVGYSPDSLIGRPVEFTAVVSSGGYPFWVGRFATDLVTGIEETEDALPRVFALQQSYPNPFNPSTQIRYELPHASYVTLKVFNTLGQEVSTLVDEHRPAGVHTIRFDASGLVSGVYLYRLEAGNFVQARKMLILK